MILLISSLFGQVGLGSFLSKSQCAELTETPKLFIVRFPSLATRSINGDSPFASIFHLQQITETDVFIAFWLTSWLTFSRQPARQPSISYGMRKKKKASTIIRLSMLFLSRGDWIRTSDHTPPRRVL